MHFAVCRWNLDASDEMIATLHDNDVKAVEPGPNYLLGVSEDIVETAGKRLAAAGIQTYSCHSAFGPAYDLPQLDDVARASAVAVCMQTILRAAAANVKCLVVHPSSGVTDDERPQRVAKLWDSLAMLLPTAEESGVRLAVENMLPNGLGARSDELRQIVDHFDSSHLGVCFDVGHANLSGEGVDEAFAALRDRIFAFHLQDNDGHKDQHSQPPYGTVDWQSLAAAIATMDFPHPAAIEAPPWHRATLGEQLWEVESLFAGRLLEYSLNGAIIHAICPKCGHYGFGTPDDWACICRRAPEHTETRLEKS